MYTICCTRYNNITWNQNVEWRRRNQYIDKCIYGSPKQITEDILFDSNMFVIEMNNQTNKIVGIGLVANNPTPLIHARKYAVYSEGNYNRYTYFGHHRVDRDAVTKQEDIRVFDILDYLLFKGTRHCKRAGGITVFPQWILDIFWRKCGRFNLAQYIRYLFKEYSLGGREIIW